MKSKYSSLKWKLLSLTSEEKFRQNKSKEKDSVVNIAGRNPKDEK